MIQYMYIIYMFTCSLILPFTCLKAFTRLTDTGCAVHVSRDNCSANVTSFLF